MSRETKERYHQCQNINSSCTFKTHESIAGMIVSPGQTNKVPIFTHNAHQPSLLH
ncbi:ogr/Delta-like zinc finger family protein [Erwinia sp. 198]|uniref:ogr/Delta-like zinc finger family protein n=1 Tax=Erwinia sp. 198 TaxID=2022746 RepID=UPI001F1A756E|nr:ogr/Delta-like zinc finger family protein [Erwinia sp. 198]